VDWFLREAKAASALNHPGIITVHEVIQSESGLAIVTEFVDGAPLRKFCGSPMAVDRAIRCGSQVAHALCAAHSRNIIHRDIKPENIMLRADGLVKVLDFGLAQGMGGVEDEVMSQLRVGTLRYMSPEQATGGRLTAATDIFSLGLVLYELVAGRHPFPAATVEATLQAICFEPPDPPSRWGREVPKRLETLILEMLAKQPEARPGAAEVASRLDKLAHATGERGGRFRLVAALAVLAAVISGSVWFWNKSGKAGSAALTPIPITATAGFDSWPDISPDGDEVVYSWGESPDAYTHIFLKRLDQDTSVKLLEAEPGTRIGHPKWSADGRRIFYKRASPRPGAESIWSIARDGKDARLTVSLTGAELSSGMDCSPDGKRIIYADRLGNVWRFGLRSLDLESGQRTALTEPVEGWGDWDPRYSPDGQKIVFKRVKTAGDDQLYVMPSKGGPAAQLTSLRHSSIFGHVWFLKDKLLVSAQLGSVIHGLWRISAERAGEQVAIFESGLDATMPAVSKNRIVWVNRVNDYNIYSVPLAGGKAVKRIASPMLDSKPAFAPDGRLAYVSRRSGSPEVWVTGADGGGAVRITDLKADVARPAWSPDGRRIAFSMQRFGAAKIFTIRCAPGTLRCETPVPLIDGENPTWSLDGRFLYFKSDEDQIWKFPMSGGQAVRIAAGLEALTSDDGKWLYLTRADTNARFCRVRLDQDGNRTGEEEVVLARGTNSAGLQHWALAGDEILFWESNINSKFSGLRAYDTRTKRLRTVVETPAAEYPAVSPDRKTVWYAQPDAAGGTLMTAEWGH
jgi:Tol biopolymer transport system component